MVLFEAWKLLLPFSCSKRVTNCIQVYLFVFYPPKKKEVWSKRGWVNDDNILILGSILCISVWVICLNCGLILPPLFVSFCVMSHAYPSPSLSLHCPSVFSGNWKLDQPAWSHCFFCPGSFSGQHLIPDTSCSPTAWLIWPCQMATDHKFWRHPLWINWTLSRSKVPLINPICLCKVHIPPTGQHCDPVQKKSFNMNVTSIRPL